MEHSQNLDEETQIANVELRQRFLRFLKWLPNKNVEAKMFGANLNGILTAVDASNFELNLNFFRIFLSKKFFSSHFLLNKLHTPTGLVEHAALRTRDTIYLKIDLPNNKKNNLDDVKMEVVQPQKNENKEVNCQVENKITPKETSIKPEAKNSEENNAEEITEMEVTTSTSEFSTPLGSTKSEGQKKKQMSVAERMTRSTAYYLERIKN
ncbi:unnamed protein product [Meloidogyne enterolobii]|uniref:Uncharacterized protein n=1 Tax=Meloidogyne enterolobii TaxID=390850 RepID=A0ACB1A0V3_MELEN